MYKLTFDEKPEANLYAKWAKEKGYVVEGPLREKLPRGAKKFDINGKRLQYRYVVVRKKGKGYEGGIPIMITKVTRKRLNEMGYSDREVDAMKPERALEIIEKQKTKTAKPAVTTSAVKKAPWQMTREEWAVERGISSKAKEAEAGHRKDVKEALKRGYTVSASVLKEYPGIDKEVAEARASVTLHSRQEDAFAEQGKLIAEGYKEAVVRPKHKGGDESAGIEGYYIEKGEKEKTVTKLKSGGRKTKTTSEGIKALKESLKEKEPPKKRGRPPKVATETPADRKGVVIAAPKLDVTSEGAKIAMSKKEEEPPRKRGRKPKAEGGTAKPPTNGRRKKTALTAEQKPAVLTDKDIHEKMVSDAQKLQIGSKAPEPKKRGRKAVAVAEKPVYQRGSLAAPAGLVESATRARYGWGEPSKISQAARGAGVGLSPEQVAESQRKAKEVISEKAEEIVAEPTRKEKAAEAVAEEWKQRGEEPPAGWMARAAARAEAKKGEKAEAEYWEKQKLTPGRQERYQETQAMLKEAREREKAETKVVEDTAKARRKAEKATEKEVRLREEAEITAQAKQNRAKKTLEKKLKKEGIDPAKRLAGVTDYSKELEQYEGAKIEAIGKGKVAKAKATEEREKKYEKTFASYEEAVMHGKKQRKVSKEEDYAEMQARAESFAKVMRDKTLTPEQKRAEIGRVGKEWEEMAKAKKERGGVGGKRKSYVVRTKKGFKVITGTKKELEAPTSLKAALAKEKRKFKKRKKLLEKPLREIKRARRVVKTTSRHVAKHMLKSPRSLVPLKGRHPAIGNVSMEYRRARISTPMLVPKSVAGVYTGQEDETKRRRR